MTNHHRAVLALALLLAACKPQAEPAAAAPSPAVATHAATAVASPAPAATPATQAPLASGTVGDAGQALQRLMAQVQRDALYPDDCVSYASEDEAGDAGFAFAVRERHGNGCPGDPQTAPVRDRFRVALDGQLQWYDVVDGDYVDYAERAQRLQALQGG